MRKQKQPKQNNLIICKDLDTLVLEDAHAGVGCSKVYADGWAGENFSRHHCHFSRRESASEEKEIMISYISLRPPSQKMGLSAESNHTKKNT